MAYDRATLAKSALCVVGAQTNFHLSGALRCAALHCLRTPPLPPAHCPRTLPWEPICAPHQTFKPPPHPLHTPHTRPQSTRSCSQLPSWHPRWRRAL